VQLQQPDQSPLDAVCPHQPCRPTLVLSLRDHPLQHGAGHKPALAADPQPTRFPRSDLAGFILPACHRDGLVPSLPVTLRMARLQERPAPRTFLPGEAIPGSFTHKVSMPQRAAALPDPWLGSSRDGKPARLRRHPARLLRPARTAATATG